MLISLRWDEGDIARSWLGYIAGETSWNASRLDGNESGNKKDDGPALPAFFILRRKGL